MEQTVQFSHLILQKIQRFICTIKICADCCHYHLKKRLKHETMCPAIVLHQLKKCLHLLTKIQKINASVQMVLHAHHTECLMYLRANTVSQIVVHANHYIFFEKNNQFRDLF